MAASQIDVVALLQQIIREHTPENIWLDSPLVGYRILGNTNRGEVGEEFVRIYLGNNGIKVENGSRVDPTDFRIGDIQFEVKTASLGAKGTFQFNHVRLDRNYGYLLCLGICPNQVVFNMWSKEEVVEGSSGKLVRMAEGQPVTHKVTKRFSEMHPIERLPIAIRKVMHGGNG